MNDYTELRLDFTPCNADITDVMAALLADEGYESFVADERGLTAYIRANQYSDAAVDAALEQLPFGAEVRRSTLLVEGQDWNHEWEKNYFKPIVVGDRCVIHSSFHTDVPSAEYDIVIDPKMAFGTGHHATTSQVISALLDLDLSGKTVIDMGSGTGILAILALMAGAGEAVGIEIDPFAAANARDNVGLNLPPEARLTIIDGDASALEQYHGFADLFLANINRNIITADIARYADAMKPGAKIAVSGFYTEDAGIVKEAAAAAGLSYRRIASIDNWASIVFEKPASL